MNKITADLIITNDGAPITDGIVVYDQDGLILDVIHTVSPSELDGVQKLNGVLVPGYVNAHCHLELSHLKGVIPTGTGLIPFIQGVVTLRDFPQALIDEKIAAGDQEMYENGIVAVGDISNKVDTASVKDRSKIRYYTFVEMFDFLQDAQARATFEQYQAVYEGQSTAGHNKKSYVPHAPYSVSQSLFGLVNEHNSPGSTISIHNQELEAENDLFIDKTGGFIDFFKGFNISIDDFEPIGKSSIHYALQHLEPHFKTIMVHNTKSSIDDISYAQLRNQETYWATCPNANLYIENTLPNYQVFQDCGAKVCIGTDSLSSNWQLSIFEEMKTIKRYQSKINDLDIVKWATYNGAQALGYDDLGRIKKGTTPGLNHIDVHIVDGKFDLNQAKSSTRIA